MKTSSEYEYRVKIYDDRKELFGHVIEFDDHSLEYKVRHEETGETKWYSFGDIEVL